MDEKVDIMKVEVKEKEPKNGIKYPCLMISTVSDKVVLFHKFDCGIDLKTGEYSIEWDTEQFTPFNGTITLQND